MKNHHSNRSHIQSISSRFRLLLTTMIVLIPVVTLLYWLFFNSLPSGFKSGLPVKITTEIPLVFTLLAFLVSLIPVAAALYGAVHLRKLFGLYEQAVVFTEANVNCFRHMGYALLAWAGASFVFVPLISLVLSFAKPHGPRSLVIQLGYADIAMLIMGLVALVISRVMQEAVILADEQMHTV